jgi:hypothetical protein
MKNGKDDGAFEARTVRLRLRLKPSIHAALKKRAARSKPRRGSSRYGATWGVSALIEEVLEQAIERWK